MSKLNISDKFVAACSPVIDTNYDTCGTITLSSIDHLSKEDLNDLFTPGGKFADLDAWFHHSIEMKACGTRTYAWYDWIMANADRTLFKAALNPGIKAVKGPSMLQPWILGRQESVVNRDFWKLTNSISGAAYTPGSANGAIGTMTAGPLASVTVPATFPGPAASTAVLRVTNRHNIPMDANWFKVRDVLHVFTLTGGVAQMGNWRVIDAAVNTSLTYIDVLVVSENGASDQPFYNLASADASSKTGLIIPGINNVNDYEKWCQNQPTLDPRKMVPFWLQSRRSSRCVDSEYLEVYARLMTTGVNTAFREFGDLDMAERNRQDELEDQKRFVNAFFFQKPISTNQTLSLWESLEDINTVTEVVLKPGLGGKLRAKRANWIGVKEQLRLCDRVLDLQGNVLNLVEFFDANYDIYRSRKSQGKQVKAIDWFTNSMYRETLHAAFVGFFKDFYGDVLQFTVEVGKENALGMIYDSYRHPRLGNLVINIIADEFFDDWRAENADLSQETAGNMLLGLEIGKPGPNGGSIYYAQIEANRKTYDTATIEELAKLDPTFRCVMKATSIQQSLTSETGTVVVECPKNSLWIENIGVGTPVWTGRTASPSYTDLY